MHNLTINGKPLMCMCFSTDLNKFCRFLLTSNNIKLCSFVKKEIFEKHMIDSALDTIIEIARQTRQSYMQANLMLHNLKHCFD